MKILLIGASSYIGARIYFDLKDSYDIVGTYNNNLITDAFVQLDIRDKTSFETIVEKYNPDVVLHLANYSSSRFIKDNEIDFNKLNLEATQNVVDVVNNYSKKLVFFSSMAATTKQDLYGELKAKSEDMVRTVRAGYYIIRPSAVIGLSPVQGHNKITDKILEVIDGKQQDFDNSWILQPTYVGHLSQAVDQIITKNLWNNEANIFINYPVTQYQIASEILKQFNLTVNPLETGRVVPLAKDNSKEIEMFDFSPKTYDLVIQQIVAELSNPSRFNV